MNFGICSKGVSLSSEFIALGFCPKTEIKDNIAP